MSMLKEERKELRDEFERLYGIHLREDDELLPIIQFITEASKLAQLSNDESKKILEDMKSAQAKIFEQIIQNYKVIIENTRKDISGFPLLISDLKKSISGIPKIPEEVKINQVRTFETRTISFLWKYFLVSSVAILIALSLAVYSWSEREKMIERYQPSQLKWLYGYYEHMEKEAPTISKKFINKNPIPKN
jgi:hypothetical protein